MSSVYSLYFSHITHNNRPEILFFLPKEPVWGMVSAVKSALIDRLMVLQK